MTQEKYRYFMRDSSGMLQTPIGAVEMIEQLKRGAEEKYILDKVEETVKELMEKDSSLLKIDAYINAYSKWTR